jgi:hypothetical protein
MRNPRAESCKIFAIGGSQTVAPCVKFTCYRGIASNYCLSFGYRHAEEKRRDSGVRPGPDRDQTRTGLGPD